MFDIGATFLNGHGGGRVALARSESATVAKTNTITLAILFEKMRVRLLVFTLFQLAHLQKY